MGLKIRPFVTIWLHSVLSPDDSLQSFGHFVSKCLLLAIERSEHEIVKGHIVIVML